MLISTISSPDRTRYTRTCDGRRQAAPTIPAATEAIADRKLRALTKAEVYGQSLPVLNHYHGAQRKLHRTYRRLLAWTCGAFLLATLVAILLGRELMAQAV